MAFGCLTNKNALHLYDTKDMNVTLEQPITFTSVIT